MKRTMVGKTLLGITACLFVGVSLMGCVSDLPIGKGAGSGGTRGTAGNGGNSGAAGNSANNGGDTGSPFGSFVPSTESPPDSGSEDAGTGLAAVWPPPGFTNVTDVNTGAYALGREITAPGDAAAAGGSSGTATPATQCEALLGVVRDFKMGNKTGGHPDFETAPVGIETGIVASTLGPDGKPAYAKAGARSTSTTGKANFDQWYNNTPGVNMPYVLALHLADDATGTATFSANTPSSFFPLDNAGFGNESQPHNFCFTTEIHTAFTYNGGETFTFTGDDDVWVFIDKKLVIDLGGRHAQTARTVTIDTLGLTKGNIYEIAVFHAERHTDQSNFQIQTTLTFANCGEIDGTIY